TRYFESANGARFVQKSAIDGVVPQNRCSSMAVAVDQEGWVVAFYTSHRHEHRCLSRRRLGFRPGSRRLVVRDHDLAFFLFIGGEGVCASLFFSLLILFF